MTITRETWLYNTVSKSKRMGFTAELIADALYIPVEVILNIWEEV